MSDSIDRPAGPGPQDYAILDRYLEAAIQLLEGGADVDTARTTLSRYLEFHRSSSLSPELEEMLIELFFQKCAKEFGAEKSSREE